jgi:hypothetical protein
MLYRDDSVNCPFCQYLYNKILIIVPMRLWCKRPCNSPTSPTRKFRRCISPSALKIFIIQYLRSHPHNVTRSIVYRVHFSTLCDLACYYVSNDAHVKYSRTSDINIDIELTRLRRICYFRFGACNLHCNHANSDSRTHARIYRSWSTCLFPITVILKQVLLLSAIIFIWGLITKIFNAKR